MPPSESFTRLVEIMARLRVPGGCPWDREQTHQSIKPYLVEETYEVLEAIDSGDDAALRSELGDLLLQVVFHAQMANEAGRFDISDVAQAIVDKLVRRHPHVFADTQVSGSSEVLRNWSRIKADERRGSADTSALAGVPRAMPALLRAHRLGEKAAHVGFDWKSPDAVVDKVEEELREVRQAIESGDQTEIASELGDLFFAVTQLARHFAVSSEEALAGSADRFLERFRHVEAELAEQVRNIHDVGADELNTLWERAKLAKAERQ